MIKISRGSKQPIYLQICTALIDHITAGALQGGHKLPGSRKMATLLSINRRTVMAAYEELEAQGWIEVRENAGCFISLKLPVLNSSPLPAWGARTDENTSNFKLGVPFSFLEYYEPPNANRIPYVIDAGYPDIRLAPMKKLARHLQGIARSKSMVKLFNYSDSFSGDVRLRQQLIEYLAETRGIQTEVGNLFITRGSLMAFYLVFQILLEKGDAVIVGNVSFKVANNIIRIAKGNLVEVPIDDQGIDVEAIEGICKKQPVRAVFIMPHHHNPTTVSLSADRRMHLLMLARTYGFAIIEDDYDYDFHYASSPILPMASSDRAESVIYIGSLSKTVAPSLRMGFIVASENVIREISKLGRFIDCHGNIAMERALSMLYEEGEIRRHLKKSLNIYQARRDLFCNLLEERIGPLVSFKKPEGGLAVWAKFHETVSLHRLRTRLLERGLLIPKAMYYGQDGKLINAIRMGFASLNEADIEQSISIIERELSYLM